MYQKGFWRNSRSLSERLKISWFATQNWSDWSKMHRDGGDGEERFHLSPIARGVWEILEDLVYLSQHVWTKCTDETPIRLQRSINKDAPSSPWVWRRATCTDSSLAVSEMASVNFFIQHIMVAVERSLVELIKIMKVKHLWAGEMSGIAERGDPLKRLLHLAAQSDTLTLFLNLLKSDRLQLIAICCNRRGVNSTPHTSHFLVDSHLMTRACVAHGSSLACSAHFTPSHLHKRINPAEVSSDGHWIFSQSRSMPLRRGDHMAIVMGRLKNRDNAILPMICGRDASRKVLKGFTIDSKNIPYFVNLKSALIELKKSASRWTRTRRKISPIEWLKMSTFDTKRICGSLSINLDNRTDERSFWLERSID